MKLAIVVALTALVGVAATLTAACGGESEGVPEGPDAAANVSTDAASDGGTRADAGAGCPAEPPPAGAACTPARECIYAANFETCGKFSCSEDGKWQAPLGALGCPVPEGMSCPLPGASVVGGPKSPIDKSCDNAQRDCTFVVMATDCCGNTLAFGVNKKSKDALQTYADTCRRVFPGCGCPASPTKVEVGRNDGGFGDKIITTCALSGCQTSFE
ncbi:MAG: hypothetical protein IPG50_27735 [Myxococcales bacterium]|nr:hypothetical protein [Myxococcales bacterium]